ncbi:MAG: 3-hydroxyacyl-CoA dehydrogenase NAD-binding domain-containing protein, partial [Planktomarina sp.]|nr:3-hydroxyacyl-CoA dehydrogenase NAD-binding domain-containing protein [Planktomarina sp.]
MKKITIIGSGLIGQGWATVFAQAGFNVAMYDTSAQATDVALNAMETRLSDMVAFNLIASSDAPEILNRIYGARNLNDAMDGAIYVQECGPEDVDFKREITTNLDAIAGSDVPIASSTSGIAA